MVKDYGQALPAMVALVSSRPAAATGLGEITGAIRTGLRADLLLCRELEDGFPVVEAVFVDGVLVHQTSYRRSR
jgi:alpha-D-ribose 1-methylphosphonate 5-triphosphate diphosphatase PhnM